MGVNLLTSKKKARAASSSGEEIISLSMLMSLEIPKVITKLLVESVKFFFLPGLSIWRTHQDA